MCGVKRGCLGGTSMAAGVIDSSGCFTRLEDFSAQVSDTTINKVIQIVQGSNFLGKTCLLVAGCQGRN